MQVWITPSCSRGFRRFLGKKSRSVRAPILLTTTVVALAFSGPLQGQEIRPQRSFELSLLWLTRQIIPNDVVPEPVSERRHLVLSYGPSREEPRSPLLQKSFVYDVALTAIAFSLSGRREEAAFVLHSLERQVRPNGSLWFSYNTKNIWPDGINHDYALVRSGAIAWSGYAFCHYLETFPSSKNDPQGLVRERAHFLRVAERLADYLLSLQVQDSASAQFGLVRGGWGTVRLKWDRQRQLVEEVYVPGPVEFVSTEHNLSTYFFLAKLAQLTKSPNYRLAAQTIAESLERFLWDQSRGQFWMGIGGSGELNRAGALDCASWGALFWLARGETAKARRALETAQRLYRSRDRGAEGHRPYYDWPIYEEREVAGFYFPGEPGKQWKNFPLVWSEGSLGVALGYMRLGEHKVAKRILNRLSPLIQPDGSVLCASHGVPFQFSPLPSVAGTAWWVILQKALTDPNVLPSFWYH